MSQVYRLHYAIPSAAEIVIYVMCFVVVVRALTKWILQALLRVNQTKPCE